MGFHDELFVQPPSTSFTCPVCYDVLQNPVAGCPEGHSFCNDCVKDEQACPVCRAPYDKGFIKSRYLDEVIQSLQVVCTHGVKPARGQQAEVQEEPQRKKPRIAFVRGQEMLAMVHWHCEWRGPVSQLQQHLDNECLLHAVPCTFKGDGCKAAVERRLMEQHMEVCEYRPAKCPGCQADLPTAHLPAHKDVCPLILVECDQCGHECLRMDVQEHKDKQCPETEVACEFATLGCDVRLKRKDMQQHRNDHAAQHAAMAEETVAKFKQQLETVNRQLIEQRALIADRDRTIVKLTQEAQGARITWHAQRAPVRRALLCRTSGYTTYSEWSTPDSDGVKYRLELRADGQDVAVYIRPAGQPVGKKKLEVNFKQKPASRKGPYLWLQGDIDPVGWEKVLTLDDLYAQAVIDFEAKIYPCPV